jgi:type VI secretion system FHA domain protein
MPEPEQPLSNASGATPQEASQPHPQPFNDPSASGPVAPALAEPVQHPAHAPEVPAAASPGAPSSESSALAGNSSPVAVQTYTDGIPTADSAFEELVLKGLMDLLAARAELKNELRMSATLIAQAENNPLKFAANVAAAKVLFAEVSKNTAYLTRAEAVTQAMVEIQEHQTALAAGMREAFKQLLKTFAPENFEEKQGASLGKIVSSPEKKAWVAYKKFYADRVSQSDDPFQDLFSAALTRAYLSALNED